MTAAGPDPRFRDQLAEWLWQRTSQPDGDRWLSPRDTVAAGHDPNNLDHAVDDLLSLIAAEVEARVQAAEQRAAAAALRGLLDVLDRINVGYVPLSLRDAMATGRAALASPAPAPRAEEGQ